MAIAFGRVGECVGVAVDDAGMVFCSGAAVALCAEAVAVATSVHPTVASNVSAGMRLLSELSVAVPKYGSSVTVIAWIVNVPLDAHCSDTVSKGPTKVVAPPDDRAHASWKST